MKKITGTILAFFCISICIGQLTLKGKVAADDNKPLESASITLLLNGSVISSVNCEADGSFILRNLKKGKYELIASHIAMVNKSVLVEVVESLTIADLILTRNTLFLEPLEIKSLRASAKTPFAKTNLSKADIAINNTGIDLPMLLNQTPGAVVNSDAGNGIGYTGIRIRGSDATRINVTINGIPYNDAESQGTFFVNLPDIASSINSIQIQRGVGSSSNGAGAFGATISLSTNEFNEKAYAELNNSYGSFNALKHTIKAGSGLLNNHFLVDMRLSSISSDGFIDRATSDLKSLYFSTANINQKSSIRFNFFRGTEKTYQAWYGIPENELMTNRTLNIAGTEKPGSPYENETDNYAQDHYQLFFNHNFSNNLSFNTGIFWVAGNGYYEQYKADQEFKNYGLNAPIINGSLIDSIDLIRQLWLKNDYYGQIFSLHYKKAKEQITLGGGWNRYIGNHFGRVIWAETSIPKNYEWYRLKAFKTDLNLYIKWQHNFNNQLDIYSDVQYRRVDYNINGFRNNPTLISQNKYDFINPKAGIVYHQKNLRAFASYAIGNKEPNRDDFEAGVKLQPKAESLHDFEVGFEKTGSLISWGVTGYYMLYKNQLILTGQINDVGAYTRANVPNSFRMGAELQATANFASWINIIGNIAFSKNKIKNSTEFIDDYDNGGQVKISHSNKDIAFSPSTVGGMTINFKPIQNGQISMISKFVSRQFLDNTMNNLRSLNPYYVQDVRTSYTIKNKLFKELNISATICNLLNNRYEANGYTFSYIYGGSTTTENYYMPMAGINYSIGLSIKL